MMDFESLQLISTFEMYDKEASGKKPNTLRDSKLYNKAKNCTHVVIRRGYTKETFIRKITDITLWKNQIIISWNPNENINLNNKFILDACCGGRMMWINKNHPNTIYIDNRQAKNGHITSKSNHKIQPDILMDFRELNFPDKSFKLVIWDPPHRWDFTKNSIMAKQYGSLNRETWPYDLKKGFDECWRVLDDFGILIFKWNEKHIKLKSILNVLKRDPLFGNVGNKHKTHWICFMKLE